LDVLGGARYWNQELDISLRVAGTLTADVQADFKRLGLSVRRSVKRSAATAIARSGDLEWVDPFVGGRIRHQIAQDKELMLEGDVGGFGVAATSPGKWSEPTASTSIASKLRCIS
jgi:hypothetical protein